MDYQRGGWSIDELIEHQHSRCEELRAEENATLVAGLPSTSASEHNSLLDVDSCIEIVSLTEDQVLKLGPAAVATKLVEQAGLNLDQKRAVALVTIVMQKAWMEENNKQSRDSTNNNKPWKIPLDKKLL